MPSHRLGVALRVLSIPVLGLSAYGIAQSVSDRPAAQVVIPASAQSSKVGAGAQSRDRAPDVRGADDPAGHDTTTTMGRGGVGPPATTGAVTTTTVSHRDDGPDNDADDPGEVSAPGTTDDGTGHDVGDDHGGTVATTATPVSSAMSGRDGDGSNGSGSDASGSSPSGSSGGPSSSRGPDSSGSGHGGDGNDGPGHN